MTGLANRWPTNRTVLIALAEVRLTRQNWIGAQEVADTLKRLGTDQGLANQILATALNAQKKYDESIGLLQTTYTPLPVCSRCLRSSARSCAPTKPTELLRSWRRS